MFHHLLVALSGSSWDDKLIDYAFERTNQVRGTIVLCHALDRVAEVAPMQEPGESLAPTMDLAEREGKRILEEGKRRLLRAGYGDVRTTLLTGKAAGAIDTYAREHDVDAIVLGTHGRSGLSHLLLGSVAEGVLRLGARPIFLLHEQSVIRSPQIRHVLVALDASDPSENAVVGGIALALDEGASLRFCHVTETREILERSTTYGYDPVPLLQLLRQDGAQLLNSVVTRAAKQGIVADTVAPEGNAAEEILAAARAFHADAVVLGTHGRRGMRRLLLGSVAEHVVRQAELPVLVMPSST